MRKHSMPLTPEATFVHPLREITLALFANNAAHDTVTLALALGSPRRPPSAARAYRVLAEDLLALLLQDGTLTRDSAGWYRLARG